MGARPFDSTKMFEDAKSMASGFTTAASPVVSTNALDLLTPNSDEQQPPQVRIVIENGTSVGNVGTLQAQLQDSADGASGWAAIQTGKALAINGDYVVEWRMLIPPKHRQWVRLSWIIASANITGGTLHAGVV